ncbi:MAG: bifunctional phosphopantothenoylcysteine decarboxylase/phosphopantothenate--cysteine ligase CoaBC [Archaeoglobaceae archaeon]|nr:bifunctional phosphopantothenoylcysteine decarboxylase/phosphopantothenate--cysteine ligase CoaBC [Archaeoglobaceae archaeon]
MHVERIRGTKSDRLRGKKIVLGVTGSIAAVETVKLARELIRRGAEVFAVMSNSAMEIIHPYALEFATGNKVVTKISGEVEHVKFFGKEGIADLFLIAPSTANTIGKIANGIDDTPVTTFATTAFGSKKPILVAPAMHEAMIYNDAVIENIEKLKRMGVEIIEPKFGEGKAKFADIEKICLHVERALYSKEFSGKKVVVTAGPTFEHIDPIRFMSNKSSGLMGKEIALELWRRGAKIVLITSKDFGIDLPNFEEIKVISVKDMLNSVLSEIQDCSLFVSSAAPSDFIVDMESRKIKTAKEVIIKLKEAPKIIKEVRKVYNGDIIGFKAETGVSDEELESIAKERLESDELSMVVANDVLKVGMGTEETRIVTVTRKRTEWMEGIKSHIAKRIVEIYIQDCI